MRPGQIIAEDVAALEDASTARRAVPIPVNIVDSNGFPLEERDESAEYAAWSTYAFLTGTEPPVQVLAQDRRRKRAVIYVVAGYTSNNQAGIVYVGDQDQVLAKQGGVLDWHASFTVENGRALWVAPDGSHSLTVTVLDERYARR